MFSPLTSHFEVSVTFQKFEIYITTSLMAKVRKLSGEAGLTDKIFTSSKNINYVHLMVLSLSTHWPINNNISFKDSYAKTTITKN